MTRRGFQAGVASALVVTLALTLVTVAVARGAPWRSGHEPITVALLDSGVDPQHPDLEVLRGWDFVDDDAEPNDVCGHGTHVAGIVDRVLDAHVDASSAASVRLLPVKVIGGDTCRGSFGAMARGIRWAVDEGADVLVLSLGCAAPCGDARVDRAVAYAWRHGALMVAAAGDASGGELMFPANLPQVLAVGAVAVDGTAWALPSTPAPDLVAPGVSVLSALPGGEHGRMSGASMAAAHVAGVAAVLMAAGHTTNQQVAQVLVGTARDLGLPGDVQGAGIVDADAALNGAHALSL